MGKIIDVINCDKNLYLESYTRDTTVEKIIDREVGNILENEFGNDAVFQDKVESNSNISQEYANKINGVFPSKGIGERNGRPDFIVVTNKTDHVIEILVDNKNSSQDINQGIEDAIFYANAARDKNFDVRVVLASNGISHKIRVFNSDTKEWVPFTIDGLEVGGIPKKTLIDLIYNDNAIGIKMDLNNKIESSKTIRNILDGLEEIYYGKYNYLSQNKNNELKIDFTIANVVFLTLLDKYKNIFKESNLIEDIDILYDVKENYSNSESRRIKQAIMGCMDLIFDKDNEYPQFDQILKEYRHVFLIKDLKNKKRVLFDYKALIEDIGNIDKNNINRTLMADIYKEFSKIEKLHESDIDIFGEIYEKLMNNKTKKDFGQFFTKRNLTRVLARLLFMDDIKVLVNKYVQGMNKDCENNNFSEVIIDFACGTGGLIIEVMHLIKSELKNGLALNNFIKQHNISYSEKNNIVKLTLKKMAEKCIYGCDIAGENVARTKVNIFFAGDGYKNVDEIDSLNENELNNFLDNKKIGYLITNIPMGSKTDTIISIPKENNDEIVFEKISNKKVSENQFLVQSVKYLEEGTGKAMIIIPDGILEGTENYELREWVIKQCKINGIVGFPKHSFAPYTHEKTYALFIQKRTKPLDYLVDNKNKINPVLKAENGIFMYIVDCDGFANSDKRFATELKDGNGKWKHNELSEWYDLSGKVHPSLLEECWIRKDPIQPENIVSVDEWDNIIPGKKYGIVKYEEILKNKIITRGNLVKRVSLDMDFCKEVGLYIEKEYTVDELIKLYNQGQVYAIDAINYFNLKVDTKRKYEYVPVVLETGTIIKGKLAFSKYLNENEIFGHNEFKFKFDFKQSDNIEVTDLKNNTEIYPKVVKSMLNAGGIYIEHMDKTPKNAQKYIMKEDNTVIGIDELEKLNNYIKDNYSQYKLEFNSDDISNNIQNLEEENVSMIIENLTSLGYEVDLSEDTCKIYNQVEKRIYNLLPEYYHRPTITESISLDEFLKGLSEIGIIDENEIESSKEIFNHES